MIHPVSTAEVNALQACMMMTRITGDRVRIRDVALAELEAAPDNDEMALCAALLYALGSDMNSRHESARALTILDSLLARDPGNWLAHVLKTCFLTWSPIRALPDIKALIASQDMVDPVPHFIVPYVHLATCHYALCERQRALETITRGRTRVPAQPVEVIPDLLATPALVLYRRLQTVHDGEFAAVIGDLLTDYFPAVRR